MVLSSPEIVTYSQQHIMKKNAPINIYTINESLDDLVFFLIVHRISGVIDTSYFTKGSLIQHSYSIFDMIYLILPYLSIKRFTSLLKIRRPKVLLIFSIIFLKYSFLIVSEDSFWSLVCLMQAIKEQDMQY